MSSAEQPAGIDPQDLSLRQLVAWLATPARCGVYLSALDLARLGRELGISISPFSRRAAIEQLIRGAALDDAVEQLFALIRGEFERHLSSYQQLDVPAMASWITNTQSSLVTWREIEEEWREYQLDLEG